MPFITYICSYCGEFSDSSLEEVKAHEIVCDHNRSGIYHGSENQYFCPECEDNECDIDDAGCYFYLEDLN